MMTAHLKILVAALSVCAWLPASAETNEVCPPITGNDVGTPRSYTTSMGLVGLGSFLVIGAATAVSRRVINLNHLLATEIDHRQKLHNELEHIANTDDLTTLQNRRTFMATLDKEIQRSARHNRDNTCVLMLDVDYFKRVNDQFGHTGGDAALKAIAIALKDVMRDQDAPGRLGGEEFAVCLPETNTEQALLVAERIRAEIEETSIMFDNKAFKVTTSIGVAQMLTGETKDQLLNRADIALYAAKREGRNRVCLAPETIS